MPARILDGLKIRDEIFAELKSEIAGLHAQGIRPGLAAVLVGENAASQIYVRSKIKACGELGIYSDKIAPPATATTEELLEVIADLNRRPEIDGILVQMPLPAHVDTRRVLEAVAPDKDADGFHPYNVGLMVAGRPAPKACTPAGIIELLKHYHVPLDGRRAVVIGRSDIVGKPMALMLLQENATVTICHSRTSDLEEECRRADILIAAIGRAAMVTSGFIAPGAVVIDVGMNRVTDRMHAERLGRAEEFERKGSALVGDVHPLDAARAAGAYTPVPGGVGPLTIAMLMANTVMLSEQRQRA